MAVEAVTDDLGVFAERDAESIRDVGVRGLAPGARLDGLDGRRHFASPTVHGARRPVELAQCVEHRAPDADAGVGLEAGATTAREVLRRLEQADHP